MRGVIVATVFVSLLTLGLPLVAYAHLHPFNPAADCAPTATGAGNESTAFFTAPGVQNHWNVVDLLPGVPGIQFIIQGSNPGKADESSGAIATPFAGNPGRDIAAGNCAQPKP